MGVVAITMRSWLRNRTSSFHGSIQMYDVMIANPGETALLVPRLNLIEGVITSAGGRRAMDYYVIYIPWHSQKNSVWRCQGLDRSGGSLSSVHKGTNPFS